MDGMRDFMRPEVVWTAVGVVLLISEFVVPGFVISFFGLGALVVGLVCWLHPLSFNGQLVLFLASSILLLVTLRKSVKRVFLGTTSDIDGEGQSRDLVGKRAAVVRAIGPATRGKVELHGTEWEAESEEVIEAGEVVEVVGQANIIFRVRKVK